MLRTHVLFVVGINTLWKRRERCVVEQVANDNENSLKLFCSKAIVPMNFDFSYKQKRLSSNSKLDVGSSHTAVSVTRSDVKEFSSWQRVIFWLMFIIVAYASVRFMVQSPKNDPHEQEISMVLKIIEHSHETERFTRVKAKMNLPPDNEGSAIARHIFSCGHVIVSKSQHSSGIGGVVVKWEVEKSAILVTFLIENNEIEYPAGTEIIARRTKGYTMSKSPFNQTKSYLLALREKLGIRGQRHVLSFLKFPKHVDRIVMISKADDIPKLYPIFCRLTGYSPAGIVEYTNFGTKEMDTVRRKSFLWIIEADSPQEIPLMQELLHVSKGSHFFDFYVTAKEAWWKWPSGIGTLNAEILRHILPRELLLNAPNKVPFLPVYASKFSTGFVISDDLVSNLLEGETGELLKLLPKTFDTERSITVVK